MKKYFIVTRPEQVSILEFVCVFVYVCVPRSIPDTEEDIDI